MSLVISMSREQGFTLVEVLIASVLLFTSLGLVYSAFSQSVINTEKAQKIIKLNGAFPLVVSKIKSELNNEIDESKREGTGVISDVVYQWSSKPVKESPLLELETNDFNSQSNSVQLIEVSVVMKVADIERQFSFKETVW